MSATAATTPSSQLKDIVTAAYGLVDEPELVEAALADCGIDLKVLQEAPGSYTQMDEILLVEALSARGETRDFAFKLGLKCPDTKSVPSFILAYSDNLRSAIAPSVESLVLVDPTRKITLSESGNQGKLTVEFTDPALISRLRYQEFALAKFFTVIRRFLNDPAAIEEVRMAHPVIENGRPVTHVLGAEFRSDTGENAFLFPRELLDKPNPNANPDLVLHLTRYAKAELQARPAQDDPLLSTRVRMLISSRVPHHWPAESDIAESLHMSSRSLTRKLAEEGTSFRKILNDIRGEIVENLLRGHTAISAMHIELGYSSSSAFLTAFKRETGMTPSEYREKLRRGEPPRGGSEPD